jgi:hypothetical protein
MNSSTIECLYVGFDGLDVAFQGGLPEAALEVLQSAREDAQGQMRPVLAHIGVLKAHVAETGSRGGYRYRFDTGEDGEIWFVKHDARVDQWNIRVSVKSFALMLHGYEFVRNRLYDRLKAMGATISAESVGRVDLAVDLRIPDFQLEPNLMVAHSHCERDTYADAEASTARVHFAGRIPSSLTIGKMPGLQTIIYDKRREGIQKQKWHWFDRWGVNWREKQPVWRVEVRAGKRHLKAYWRVTAFEDLDATLADIVTAAMAKIRYLDPTDHDSNVTRRAEHPLWTRVRDELLAHLDARGIVCCGVVPGQQITGKRSVLKALYRKLITGLAAPYAAIYGLESTSAEKIVEKISSDIRAEIRRNPERFANKVTSAKDRMILIEDSYPFDPTQSRSEC